MVIAIRNVANQKFFQRNVAFSDKRYQHREVAARLLFLEDSILSEHQVIDTKKTYLDEMVRKYKKKPIHARKLEDAVDGVLTQMTRIFGTKDRLLKSQANVPIYYLLTRSAVRQGLLDRVTRDRLTSFAKKVEENRELAERNLNRADFQLLEFDRMSIQGTNDAGSITGRVKILLKYCGLRRPSYV